MKHDTRQSLLLNFLPAVRYADFKSIGYHSTRGLGCSDCQRTTWGPSRYISAMLAYIPSVLVSINLFVMISVFTLSAT